jgi:hypothetical protein
MFLNLIGHFVTSDMLPGRRERVPREASLKGTPKAGRGHLHLRCKCRCEGQSRKLGSDHYPKTEAVSPVVRTEVAVATGTAGVPLIGVPRAPAHHPGLRT